MKEPTRNGWGSLLCLVVALVLLLCGWLMPVHLHALDIAVVRLAGSRVGARTDNTVATANPHLPGIGHEALTPFLIHLENRNRVLDALKANSDPVVQALLGCRDLTNTVLFPPSSSASGQAFDVAVAECGLLAQDGHITSGMRDSMLTRANAALRGGDSEPIEEILMDAMSLGQRFGWEQLESFTDRISDPNTLSFLAASARNAGAQLPVVVKGVELSQKPEAVVRYLSTFSVSGMADLAKAEQFGPGAVDELLSHNERLFDVPARDHLGEYIPFSKWFRASSDYALRIPGFALTLKWFFFLAGGFLLALALRLGRLSSPEIVAQQGGYPLARDVLFAFGFLLAVLLLSEPFLSQEIQKGESPFRLHLPAVGGMTASQIAHVRTSFMTTTNLTTSLLTLLLFFVLQALIFAACLAKLRQVLRQNLPPRVKLKLLENEEHLFDAGLYLGFVGTIICLILVSLGILQFSLMAAYSSTSFGIVFVSILKIFYVRPARGRLVLLSEQDNGEAPVRAAAPTFATTP